MTSSLGSKIERKILLSYLNLETETMKKSRRMQTLSQKITKMMRMVKKVIQQKARMEIRKRLKKFHRSQLFQRDQRLIDG